MTEIDAINQRLNGNDERFKRGEEKFSEVADALLDIKAHLLSQDTAMATMAEKIDNNVQGTQSIVEMWNGGVKAVRFFCRLAEAWRFLMKQVLLPFGLPLLALYGGWYYSAFHRFPEWLADCFKFLMAVL